MGDFDGNAVMDVAVANQTGNSVSVYHNDGAGHLSKSDYAAGNQPVSVAAADFNRDGRSDLAVALAGETELAVWPAQAGGAFSPATGQKIFLQNQPSAVQADNLDGASGADALLGFADYYKLALCVSDPAGVLSYAYAINSLGDVELDPVNHVTLTENSVLSVAGGTSAGGVCTRSGVAAVAEQPFNLVHLPRSQDLSFSVVNLGSQTALLNLELYDDAGSLRQAVTPAGRGRPAVRALPGRPGGCSAPPPMMTHALGAGLREQCPRHLRLLAGQRRQHAELSRWPSLGQRSGCPVGLRAPYGTEPGRFRGKPS